MRKRRPSLCHPAYSGAPWERSRPVPPAPACSGGICNSTDPSWKYFGRASHQDDEKRLLSSNRIPWNRTVEASSPGFSSRCRAYGIGLAEQIRSHNAAIPTGTCISGGSMGASYRKPDFAARLGGNSSWSRLKSARWYYRKHLARGHFAARMKYESVGDVGDVLPGICNISLASS